MLPHSGIIFFGLHLLGMKSLIFCGGVEVSRPSGGHEANFFSH